MELKPAFLSVLVLLCLTSVTLAQSSNDQCVYSLYIKTGPLKKAETNATISVDLWTKTGDTVNITDIKKWGGLKKGGGDTSYFRKDQVDAFSGRGKCISGSVCGLRLISDGSGSNPGWYVNYVEVTVSSAQSGCNKAKFQVEQWLDLNAWPRKLTATVDNCAKTMFIPIIKTTVDDASS